MELLKLLFCELSGVFSWRKAMTCVTVLVFATACVGFLIANKFKELPGAYESMISGVFLFYFVKGIVEGKKLKVE